MQLTNRQVSATFAWLFPCSLAGYRKAVFSKSFPRGDIHRAVLYASASLRTDWGVAELIKLYRNEKDRVPSPSTNYALLPSLLLPYCIIGLCATEVTIGTNLIVVVNPVRIDVRKVQTSITVTDIEKCSHCCKLSIAIYDTKLHGIVSALCGLSWNTIGYKHKSNNSWLPERASSIVASYCSCVILIDNCTKSSIFANRRVKEERDRLRDRDQDLPCVCKSRSRR